jgi:phage-related protein
MPFTLPASPRPIYPATETTKPELRGSQFGDGPEDRKALGLNQFPVTLPLQWAPLPMDKAKILTTFFEARLRNNQAFLWTPPDRPQARWRCPQWSLDGVGRGLYVLRAVFVQSVGIR